MRKETSAHICECEALASLRNAYLGSLFLQPDNIKSFKLGGHLELQQSYRAPMIRYGAQRAPLFRPRCIGAERPQTQLLIYPNLNMIPSIESYLKCTLSILSHLISYRFVLKYIPWLTYINMKKRKCVKRRAVNSHTNREKQVSDTSDNENQGFGNWLQSSKGVAYMKLFITVNVILMLMTLNWPRIADIMGINVSFFTE